MPRHDRWALRDVHVRIAVCVCVRVCVYRWALRNVRVRIAVPLLDQAQPTARMQVSVHNWPPVNPEAPEARHTVRICMHACIQARMQIISYANYPECEWCAQRDLQRFAQVCMCVCVCVCVCMQVSAPSVSAVPLCI